MTIRRIAVLLLVTGLIAGCALYSDVSISPLLVPQTNVDRGSDATSMLRKADYVRLIEFAPTYESKRNHSAQDLLAIGSAEVISGRYDPARRHLRTAIDLNPFHTTYSEIAWQLSQLEFQSNNFEAALDWAHIAAEHGLIIKQWHTDYLGALSNVDVYRTTGSQSERMPLHIGRPDVPRIDSKLNGKRDVTGIIDSGAVLSIVSRSVADQLAVKKLGNFQGTFFGLLGEPISVQFGLLDSVQLGRMNIANVPVAIMPDDKLKFLITGQAEFKMDFLLGANLLKEFRTELDYRRRQVTFTHLTAADHRPSADQNLFIVDFRPAVRGFINRRGWYMFLLDTGSEVSFLNEGQLGSLPIQVFAPKAHNATLQGLGGAKKRGAKVENVEIGIDRWAGTFRDIPMYEPPPQEKGLASGIVGENFLKNFIVTIDFGRMRMDLQPLVHTEESPIPEHPQTDLPPP
jgi:hypothetical protein